MYKKVCYTRAKLFLMLIKLIFLLSFCFIFDVLVAFALHYMILFLCEKILSIET